MPPSAVTAALSAVLAAQNTAGYRQVASDRWTELYDPESLANPQASHRALDFWIDVGTPQALSGGSSRIGGDPLSYSVMVSFILPYRQDRRRADMSLAADISYYVRRAFLGSAALQAAGISVRSGDTPWEDPQPFGKGPAGTQPIASYLLCKVPFQAVTED